MKTTSEELFQLIKSLDASEKRSFKSYSLKNADKNRSTNYIRLFDAIDGQDKYNESVIKKQLQQRSLSFNFKKAKNYLFNSILESLKQFHASTSVDSQLQQSLHEIEILFNKRMFVSAKKIISKAEALALEYERQPYLLIILSWKREVIRARMNLKEDLEKQLIESFADDFKATDNYKNYLEYHQLHVQTSLHLQRKNPFRRITFEKKEINEWLKNPLLTSEKYALSFGAKRSYYNSLINIYIIFDDLEKVYFYSKRWVGYLEKDSHHLHTHAIYYMQVLAVLTDYQVMLKKYDEYDLYYEKLIRFFNSLPPKLKTKQGRSLILRANNNHLYSFLKRCRFSEAINEIRVIQENQEYKSLMAQSTRLTFYFISSTAFLITGDYKHALYWLSKLTNTNEKEIRPDLRQDAKIINIIIQFELGNTDYLPYLIRSTLASLNKGSHCLKLDVSIVKFFQKKIMKWDGETDLSGDFLKLKKEIEIITKNPIEAKALIFFDYLAWVESKIRKCTMAEVLIKK